MNIIFNQSKACKACINETRYLDQELPFIKVANSTHGLQCGPLDRKGEEPGEPLYSQ